MLQLAHLAERVAAVISLPPKEAVLLEFLQALLESIFLLLKELRLQHLIGFLANPRKSLLAGRGSAPRAELGSGRTQRWHIILLHQHKTGGARVSTRQEIDYEKSQLGPEQLIQCRSLTPFSLTVVLHSSYSANT